MTEFFFPILDYAYLICITFSFSRYSNNQSNPLSSSSFLLFKSDYFQPLQRREIVEVFTQSNTAGMYDTWCTVKGGGMTGQAGAVRLGVARALEAIQVSLEDL